MGKYSRIGFFSNLPINYNDDIVVFLVGMLPRSTSSSSRGIPYGIIRKGILPISLPFFGKYNGFGRPMSIVNDLNSQYFKRVTNKDLEGFCFLQQPVGCFSIEELKKNIIALKEIPVGVSYRDSIDLLIREDSELVELLEKILKVDQADSSLEVSCLEKLAVTFTIELKVVYDKMVELSSFKEDIEEAFNNTTKASYDNPFTYAKEPDLLFAFLSLHSSFFPDATDYRLYSHFPKDINLEGMKKEIIDYAHFLDTLYTVNGCFDLSSFGGEDKIHRNQIEMKKFEFNYLNNYGREI